MKIANVTALAVSLLVITALVTGAGNALQRQSQAAMVAGSDPASPDGPKFEVASVKLTPVSADGTIGWAFRQNGFDGTYVTIKTCIQAAYDIKNWDWIVGPGWLNDGSPTFSIHANASGPVPAQSIRIMLQHLLAERFGLKTHKDFREQPVYALVTGKGGIKLQPVQHDGIGAEQESDRGVRPLPMGLRAKGASMMDLSGFLTNYQSIGAPVIDMTGISGRFDFDLRYSGRRPTPRSGEAESADAPTIFEAIQEIGLKLEARKAPVEILVVDAVNKTATEN